MKTYAKNPITNLYYNGTNFSAPCLTKAKELSAGTTADAFRLVWACPVEIVSVDDSVSNLNNCVEKSKAARRLLRSRGWLKQQITDRCFRKFMQKRTEIGNPNGWTILEMVQVFKDGRTFSEFTFMHGLFGTFKPSAYRYRKACEEAYEWAMSLAMA